MSSVGCLGRTDVSRAGGHQMKKPNLSKLTVRRETLRAGRGGVPPIDCLWRTDMPLAGGH